jgi:hypothetical protein
MHLLTACPLLSTGPNMSLRAPALNLSCPVVSPRLAASDGPSLGTHVLACARARGRTFALRCLGERVHNVVGPRVVSTVFAAAALIGLLSGLV